MISVGRTEFAKNTTAVPDCRRHHQHCPQTSLDGVCACVCVDRIIRSNIDDSKKTRDHSSISDVSSPWKAKISLCRKINSEDVYRSRRRGTQ